MIRELQDKILKLKKEKNVGIVAHSYQASEITEIADVMGDSFQLSVAAQKMDADTIIMCGVRFMAETVKILSPQKKVVLAVPEAGCPMAEQILPYRVEQYKKENPSHIVAAYINTTAALKTVCDVCVTSSTAVKIISKIEGKDILFIPDCNLGDYVKRLLPQKNIILWQGGCPIHTAVNKQDVLAAKALHPNVKILMHPECIPEVLAYADFVGSTSAIMEYAAKSEDKEFIIGTEISIAEHLSYQFPEKSFYILSRKLVCQNMKLTSLMDVYKAVAGVGGEEIILDESLRIKAKRCIDEMIRLGE
jgi:quinolinate synthase